MEQYKFFIPGILSEREELLKKVMKSKVISMIKYGLEPKEKFACEYELDEEAYRTLYKTSQFWK